MSQLKLSSYYPSRKKRSDNKLIKNLNVESELNSKTSIEDLKNVNLLKTSNELLHSPKKLPKLSNDELVVPGKSTEETSRKLTNVELVMPDVSTKEVTKISKTAKSKSKTSKKTSKTQTKLKKQTKNKETDIREVFQTQNDKNFTEDKTESVENVLNVTYTVDKKETNEPEESLIRTPKRNLSNPEEQTDSKRKKKLNETLDTDESHINKGQSDTPYKHVELSVKQSARKNLFPNNESKNLDKTYLKERKSDALSNTQDISMTSEKLEFLKEQLSKFDKTYKKIKEFKSNKCKLTSVVSLDIHKRPETEDKVEETISTPAYIEYHNLAEVRDVRIKKNLIDPNLLDLLVLPYKYKVLSKTFQCSDTVVNMIYNRKEVCTFTKLKNGVQDMTKRNFSKSNLGQIKTVYPLAYTYHIEKNSSAVRNRNPGTPLYELVITPNFEDDVETNVEKSKSNKKATKSDAFIPMTPALLIARKRTFVSNLLSITLKHHQNFLARLSPPVIIPINKITKWHPKFNIDSVPDIVQSELPEPPNQQSASTAKDILSKLKETAGEKVVKALQKVTEESEQTKSTPVIPEKKRSVTHQLLKNVSSDILERIRARESAKIIEDMTQAPKNKKRMEMLERLPELIRILRTYFITERKAAISLEDATQKIMDSYHSSMNPEDIKQHLQLIADIFPKWLLLIPIRKGLFLKIDKATDINVLLSNIPAQ